jgi:SAM-dependent methyltransferase
MTSRTGYARRASWYAAEISQVPESALLAGLLRPGLAVAEMPSGTGHFLPAYSSVGASITFVDACPHMLSAAQDQASQGGIAIATVCGMIEDLPGRTGPFSLIVMPNGALNQLAVAAPPGRLLTAVARLLVPDGLFLAQVLAPDAACGFYDPELADGDWHQDRQFPGDEGVPVSRRRRQHHEGDIVRIEFELRTPAGCLVHRQQVALKLMAIGEVHAVLAGAGLRVLQCGPGPGGLTEILCARQTQRPR